MKPILLMLLLGFAAGDPVPPRGFQPSEGDQPVLVADETQPDGGVDPKKKKKKKKDGEESEEERWRRVIV